MNTWKVICATLVIFVAGIVTGGVMVGYGARQKGRGLRPIDMSRPPGVPPNPQAGNNSNFNPREPGRPPIASQLRQPRIVSQEFLEKLNNEVRLTQVQRERIEEVIADGQQRNKELWDRITPELRREMQETQKRIRDILTPAQRQQFEELMKRPQRRNDEPLPPGTRPRDLRRPTSPNSEGQPDKAP